MIITRENIEDHIWELATGQREDGLGILHRGDTVKVEIGGDDIEILQSTSLLYEKSTGAVVWESTLKFANYVQNLKTGRLHDLIFNHSVIELGCGTGALARLLAEKTCQKWIATDQKPLLKLARKNTAMLPNVEVLEFDWEEHEFNSKISNPVIVAVDTIYNFYLIDPLVQGILSVWRAVGNCPVIIVVQLRDEQVLQDALAAFMALFTVEYFDALPGIGTYLLTSLS